MIYQKCMHAFLLLFTTVLMTIGCSNAKSPIEPSKDDLSGVSENLPVVSSADSPDRTILAAYDAVLDPTTKTFTVTPLERSTQYHYPLTRLYPNVLQITGFGFTPNFWADIKLKHPFPGSAIDGFDPRVIAILPANPGVRFIYPIFGVGGNNSVVLEPDGYTRLFDSLGGLIPGNVNPFKAYFKDQPFRVWSGTGVTEETQRWNMNLDGFGGQLRFKLVVDISTNYPKPPTPVIDNAPEPYEIGAEVSPGLSNQGGSVPVEVRVKHWKDVSDIGGVVIESPDLFNNTLQIQYYSYSPFYNASVYKGMLSNEKLAPEGEHKLLVKSWDAPSGIEMFNEFNANVEHLTTDGNLMWAKRDGGIGDDHGCINTALSDDSIIVAGEFMETATFGQDEPNQTVLTSDGDYDGVIARYKPDGSFIWAKRFGGPYCELCRGITTLSDNSVIVTGSFWYTATFGSGESNETTLYSSGGDDIFIARYNPDGILLWARNAGGTWEDWASGVTTLTDNSIVVCGIFHNSATFGKAELYETTLISDGKSDIFVARYRSNGMLLWAKRAGGVEHDYGIRITTLSDNSTVITGAFTSSSTFGSGEPNEIILHSASTEIEDIFIAKYNPNGRLAWAKRAGGLDYDGGAGITTLSDNSVVVTGYFTGSATFGEGESNQIVLTGVLMDVFIAHYNTDGTLAWAKSAGGYEQDAAGSIITLSDNSTVLIGFFFGPAIFGSGEPNETELVHINGYDTFIACYNSDGRLEWAKRVVGCGREAGNGITVLSDNSTVICGWFDNEVIFGPGEPDQMILISAGQADHFLARFAP